MSLVDAIEKEVFFPGPPSLSFTHTHTNTHKHVHFHSLLVLILGYRCNRKCIGLPAMPSTGGACSLSSPFPTLHSPFSSICRAPAPSSPQLLLLTRIIAPGTSGSLAAWGASQPPPTNTNWRRVKCRHQDTKPEGIDWNQKMKAGNIFTVHAYGNSIPNQAESVVSTTTAAPPEYKSLPDLDYLQELLAIQQQGPRAIGFFGTRNMGFMHQQLIEVLSYAMVITNNHIYTSGASGTNAAVIRGALRAERPDLLTVILPQSLKMQPPESQELLAKVQNLVEMPHNDELPLIEASRLCNMDILSHVQQVICFAFHDSKLLMETCSEAKNLRKIVTLFYLD